ncbi:hypothetical protein ABZY14_40070 [Streptomyces sp. NPDC006617]|uniref:hypothetical protein n=1 Tax=Streptomyces sp. NPDC006617 TaxID=3155354 RepID=UPI0033B06187
MPRSDAWVRVRTRLLLMYNLTPQVHVPDDRLRPLSEAFGLGRFTAHVEAAGLLLPRLVLHEHVLEITLPPNAARVDGADLTLAVTPRQDPLLFVDVEFPDDAGDSDAIAETSTPPGRTAPPPASAASR